MEYDWQKSSFSTGDPNQNCLEVGLASNGSLGLRESDDPATVLTTSPARLAALLRRVDAGATRDGPRPGHGWSRRRRSARGRVATTSA